MASLPENSDVPATGTANSAGSPGADDAGTADWPVDGEHGEFQRPGRFLSNFPLRVSLVVVMTFLAALGLSFPAR